MRTAEEIINEYWKHPTDLLKDVPKMINEARKEAIQEASKKATLKIMNNIRTGVSKNVVDKQSILSLIDELK